MEMEAWRVRTTSSMAFDPTPEIAAIAHRHGMWVHVDAAMSGIGQPPSSGFT